MFSIASTKFEEGIYRRGGRIGRAVRSRANFPKRGLRGVRARVIFEGQVPTTDRESAATVRSFTKTLTFETRFLELDNKDVNPERRTPSTEGRFVPLGAITRQPFAKNRSRFPDHFPIGVRRLSRVPDGSCEGNGYVAFHENSEQVFRRKSIGSRLDRIGRANFSCVVQTVDFCVRGTFIVSNRSFSRSKRVRDDA